MVLQVGIELVSQLCNEFVSYYPAESSDDKSLNSLDSWMLTDPLELESFDWLGASAE